LSGLADSLLARIVKQRNLLQAMDEHCKSISTRVTSRDRSVTVEVDGIGAMTGLWLGPRATKLGADALAKLIVDTAAAAAQLAQQRHASLLAEFTARMRAVQKEPLTRWDGTTFTPNG
jgi:DNA-binding protein YbaB